jgi:RimJ/RimL family protein N-acetyltransferase
MREEHKRAELGYWIGVPYWNHGYASEAARRVVNWGFQYLGLNRIYAQHFADNPASGRVMQKIGMQYEGTLRQPFIRLGEARDSVCYGILKDEWETMQKPD